MENITKLLLMAKTLGGKQIAINMLHVTKIVEGTNDMAEISLVDGSVITLEISFEELFANL